MSEENIYLSKTDYATISALLENIDNDIADSLWEEMDRAIVVPVNELPENVVAMYSLVEFIDLDTQQKSRIQLVMPNEADIREERISILAPVGSALIGLAVGQTIDWPLEGGKFRKLQVTSVKHKKD